MAQAGYAIEEINNNVRKNTTEKRAIKLCKIMYNSIPSNPHFKKLPQTWQSPDVWTIYKIPQLASPLESWKLMSTHLENIPCTLLVSSSMYN